MNRPSIAAVTTLILALLATLLPASAQNAYIANNHSDDVSVIDTVTNTMIVPSIPVGAEPTGVAVTPDGSKVYVANQLSNDISVIDTVTQTVIVPSIPVGSAPVGVAVTPDGSKVYVTNKYSGNVSVIDTVTQTVIVPSIPVGSAPVGVAVTADGSKVYVANQGSSGNVSVIATATNTVVATIPVGYEPTGAAVTPDGSKVYVTNNASGNVSVIATATNMVVATIRVGAAPLGVAVTPDGSKVYVTHEGGANVSVIATATNMVVGTIPVGIAVTVGVAVTPDGSKVYVANQLSNDISVIDTATNTIIVPSIPVGSLPFALGMFIQPVPTFAGTPGSRNGAAALPAISRRASAQAYPTRPVRIVVPASPGGTADIAARLMGQWLSERLRQPFVIENRPGGDDVNPGTEAVVRAPPDGYTLLLVQPPNAMNAALYDKLNYNFIRDVTPIAGILRVPNVMEVNPSVPAKTVPEFITYARVNPDKINMAFGGNGSSSHLAGELFKMMTGISIRQRRYSDEALAVIDLLNGHVQVMFSNMPDSIKHIRSGRLRPLAVTSTTRSQALPDVPTVGDFLAGYEVSSWLGLGAPRNTPAEIIDKLNGEIEVALADPKIQARLANLGVTALVLSPNDFEKFIEAETEKWGKVIKFTGIKPR
jgi:YVTN family beta-propeller protein